MTRLAALAVLLGLPASALAAAPAAAPRPVPAAAGGPSVMNLSLIEGIAAIELPQVQGLFAFIPEQDASFAFSDLLARDPRSLKRYVSKLREDKKASNGLTSWDHEVCGTLVNLYASALGATLAKPRPKDFQFINECVLSPVVPLAEIVSRRKR